MNEKDVFFAAAFAMVASWPGSLTAAPAAYQDPLGAQGLGTIKSRFIELMQLANQHDLKTLHTMFWQSPSVLLVTKAANPSEGNWAGFWGNAAVDQKLHDIATSGPVVLVPDLSKLKIVGLTLSCCRKRAEKCSFSPVVAIAAGISLRSIPDIAAVSGIPGGIACG